MFGNGNVGNAVDLLYQLNYVDDGKSIEESSPEMYTRIVKISEFCDRLSLRTISCPECVVLDPKLIATFCRYYKNWSLEDLLKVFDVAKQPAVDDSENGFKMDEYHVAIQSFRTENSFLGLRALWIWQCQKTATSPGLAPWALRIEAMFNWVRFFGHFSSKLHIDEIVKKFLKEAEAKNRRPRYVNMSEWLSVLSGAFCTIPVGSSLRFPRRTSVLEMFRDASLEFGIHHIQQTNSNIRFEGTEEFDSAFILSGPFQLSLTDNILEHLTFSTTNPQTLLIYYNDTQCNPGLGAILFRDNIISDGFR